MNVVFLNLLTNSAIPSQQELTAQLAAQASTGTPWLTGIEQ